MGHTNAPTAAVIDAQCNRSSPPCGERGFDGGKKVKGRKRSLVVDTMGLVIALSVTAASVQHREAAAAVVAQACSKAPGLERLYTEVRTEESVLATMSSCTISVSESESYGVQETARREPCTTLRKQLGRPKKSTRGSWLCRSAGSSSEHMRGLSAGAVRPCITTAEARMPLNRLAYWV
jgi:hypothetical protein